MLFEEIEEQSLDDLLEDVQLEAENEYISDSKKAVELIARLVHNQKQEAIFSGVTLKKKMSKVFELMSECNIADTFEQQRNFEKICGKLSEWRMVDVLKGKKIVGLGGKFSSGKSQFINAITGIEDSLPVDQNPTTSVPSYIVHADVNEIEVNTSFGYACKLEQEAMKALSHEFYNKYGIGFSAFLENIVIKTTTYELQDDIILLDTPGYSKAETESNIRERNTDKQKAYDKLSIADYLIWLVDIENGTITTDDLEFINDLKLSTKILFVFTKADKVTDEGMKAVLKLAKETIDNAGIPCYGVTAYSSINKQEYFGDYINTFLKEISLNEIAEDDFYSQIEDFGHTIENMLSEERAATQKKAKEYFEVLSKSDNIISIKSIAELWKYENMRLQKIDNLINVFRRTFSEINHLVRADRRQTNDI